MENWYNDQYPYPIDTTRGKPVYTEEEPEECPEWKNPKKHSIVQREDQTSDDSQYDVVKVGRKVLPRSLARMQKDRHNSR